MYQFNYQKAGSADEAANAVTAAEDGRFLAGGMTLIPTLKQRLAQPRFSRICREVKGSPTKPAMVFASNAGIFSKTGF